MRSVPGRLCCISLALIIALAALSPGAGALSPDFVPMPPGDFILYRSDHFDIYYDEARITDVSDVVVGAEAAYKTVTDYFGPYDNRMRIILAANHQQYINILYNYRSDYNASEHDVASSYGDGERSTILIEAPDQIPNFEAVMAHELSHISIRTKLIDNKYSLPAWFSEGLSTYVSGDLSDSARAAVEESCRNNKFMTVAQMEAIYDRSDNPETSEDEVSLAHAQSGMLTEYIIAKYGNESVKLILQDFGPTGDLDKAFMKRVGYTPEDINADWMMTLKGQLGMKNGQVLSQRVYGYVLDAGGSPIANETIAFTCVRNDTSVFGKTYTAVTNGSGYYKADMTYGPFTIHLDRPGYSDVDDNITLQKNEARQYNATMARVEAPVQNTLLSPGLAGDQTVYVALGILNAAAILLIAFVFWRARQ